MALLVVVACGTYAVYLAAIGTADNTVKAPSACATKVCPTDLPASSPSTDSTPTTSTTTPPTAPAPTAQTQTPRPAPIQTANYISMGNIPTTGLQVGVTFYGALESPRDGKYIVSNYVQGGEKNGGAYGGYDDNGEGSCEGKYTNLANQSTWAENQMGKALGNLPCGTKLELSYNGHSIIAEKADTSNGGCEANQVTCFDNGIERKVDLWWQTAKALCLSDQPAVITIHVVPNSTPTTSIQTYRADTVSSYAVCY